ncbi:hypothetical protein F443_02390 [Phytophthora nicotianae P1569]|uniref:Uncharacterized protein n=1 Tax=Phytophthora nicotianae P1569 TaxID=1317065 RepID=V9FV08_PHYNI|nr:hypothetical protein F443_02390 [Phytophthora nicotianae P1569]
MPAAPTAAASSATLHNGTQSSTLVPVSSPAPAETSEELTVDSLRDLLADSADATVGSVRTALLPYLTLMAPYQVQLSISPPLQGDIRTQRRLNDALGFDQVLAVVPPLSDTLQNLPHAVGELTAQLEISREEAINRLNRLKPANDHIGSVLKKSKESMDVQTEKLRLAMDYAEQRQYIIDALGKQIERKREVFKTTVSANTENTCKLHDLLLKSTQGTWVDANTAALIADPTDRNLQLLRPNRALQGFVSFAGMNPTLVIQDTLLALQRFQQKAGDQEDPFALAEALIKTAQQVQSSASKRSRHGSNDGSSDDTSEEKTPVSSGRATRAASTADVGKRSPAAASSPTPSHRGLHMSKAWKNKPKSKRQKTASRSPASVRSRSNQVSRRSTSRPPARSP